jgi:transcriptional regulatory protein RtcR
LVQLCAHGHFPVDRLKPLHNQRHLSLARHVMSDIAKVSSGTEVLLRRMNLGGPCDLQEVYGAIFDFAREYGFDEDRERYHVLLTTGTYVAQICWYLLTESRHMMRLVQTGPPRGEGEPNGKLEVIDLDLRRYDAPQRRFDLATREHARDPQGWD